MSVRWPIMLSVPSWLMWWLVVMCCVVNVSVHSSLASLSSVSSSIHSNVRSPCVELMRCASCYYCCNKWQQYFISYASYLFSYFTHLCHIASSNKVDALAASGSVVFPLSAAPSWYRFLGCQRAVDLIQNPVVVGCHIFLPGPRLPFQLGASPNVLHVLGDRGVSVCVCEQLAQSHYVNM